MHETLILAGPGRKSKESEGEALAKKHDRSTFPQPPPLIEKIPGGGGEKTEARGGSAPPVQHFANRFSATGRPQVLDIVRRAMYSFVRDCSRAGIRVVVTSTDRSAASQRRLYEAWLARGRTGLPAAPPGSSTHEYGVAFDATYPRARTDEVVAIAERHGLVWFGPKDWVHFDPFGPAAWRELLADLRRQ
jgi:hypothetical protein